MPEQSMQSQSENVWTALLSASLRVVSADLEEEAVQVIEECTATSIISAGKNHHPFPDFDEWMKIHGVARSVGVDA